MQITQLIFIHGIITSLSLSEYSAFDCIYVVELNLCFYAYILKKMIVLLSSDKIKVVKLSYLPYILVTVLKNIF